MSQKEGNDMLGLKTCMQKSMLLFIVFDFYPAFTPKDVQGGKPENNKKEGFLKHLKK